MRPLHSSGPGKLIQVNDNYSRFRYSITVGIQEGFCADLGEKMKGITVFCAAALIAGVGMAQEGPSFQFCGQEGYPPCYWEENGKDENEKKTYVDPGTFPSAASLCETSLGYGLVSYTTDKAMFDAINRRLEAGETVVSENGFTILGTTTRADGQMVICFRY